MHTALAIAAGGGGDAITAAMLATAMPELRVSAIMSYSWDRFMMDPTPGPRSSADFQGLAEHGGVATISATSTLRTGTSTLPRLAGSIAHPVLLLEAHGGAAGMASSISNAAAMSSADELIVVDVGGDIIAEGHEIGLLSPLADSLALAAAVLTGIPTRVLIAGPGVDGELSPGEVHARLSDLGADRVAGLTPADAAPFADLWSWHPSEANSLLAMAADGWRGAVETQRRAVVDLTDDTTGIYEVDAQALAQSSLAAPLASTNSLDQAEQLLRDRRSGRSELDIERRKAAGEHSHDRMPTLQSLNVIDAYGSQARDRGIDALTLRRVAELVHAVSPATTSKLRELLAMQRPDNFHPPLYGVRAV
ncbi:MULTISPECIES: DUF1152 domain-containing protein [unclassified Nocardia]|uniref:DUF1152 domain-containing protein n=1 Tax=unclassified Nocardia TaxID=2637762 RepID=UPI0024A94F83|nr:MULTISPECIES: DUF1152 domain-containing protein [unclassified Nocardia]